jgi:hypothetical protein
MPRNFTDLRKLMAQLYRDRGTARLVAEDAGLDVASIPTHDVMYVYWQNILTEADNTGRLAKLLELAAQQYPAKQAELVAPPDEPDRGAVLSTQQVRVGLRKLLETNFSLEELANLCFDMGIEYENLPGATRGAKARELVQYCERRLRVGELVETGRALRPELPWPAM